MISKTNLHILILLLLLVPLMVGCGGTRQGGFIKLDGGVGAVAANEQWEVIKYKEWSPSALEQILNLGTATRTRKVIGRTSHSEMVVERGPAVNFKIGYGFSEKLLVSYLLEGLYSRERWKLVSGFMGITYFAKKTAPSLFFDIVLPMSEYDFSKISDSILGPGASVGVGYEFWKHWTVQMDFSFGLHNADRISWDQGPVPTDRHISTGAIDAATRANSSSLIFTIGCIWY